MVFLILMTCTGCTIEYNITINKDNIEETILVNDYISSTRTEHDILNNYNMWYPTYVNYIPDGKESIEITSYKDKVEGIEYHTKSINNINNGYSYTYKYTYPLKKYYDAYTLATTFIDSTVYKGYNTLVLKTGKKNLLCNYNHFDSLKVNIKVDPLVYKLNYTNSSDIRNNTYSWILNKSNCNDSQIILTLDQITTNISSEQEITNTKKTDYTIYIFYIIIIVIILLGYLVIKRLKKKNEKFDD